MSATKRAPSAARAEAAPDPNAIAAPPSRVLGIRWIVSGAAGLLIAVSMASLGLVSERDTRAALEEQLEGRLLLQVRNLALSGAPALLGDYPELTLHPLIREMLARQPELASATVVDRRGIVQGDADVHRLGAAATAPQGFSALGRPGLEPGERLLASGDLLLAEAPVRTQGGDVLGTARVALRRSYIDTRLAVARRQQALVLSLFLALGVVSALVLMSWLLRPIGALRAGLERIGRGDLEHPIPLRNRTELGLLAGSVNDMAAALRRAQAEMVERARLAHEVELAREVQRSLLPGQPLRLGTVRVLGDHEAASEVGGDYWDVLPREDGRILLAIADVAGKGLAGCLVMSMLAALLRAGRDRYDSPARLLVELDARLSESLRPGVFVTMFLGLLDPATGRLAWASAGHNPPLVFRGEAGHIERFAGRGIPLGAIRGGAIRSTLRDVETVLGAGDLLLQYTDGYTEAFDPAHASMFGIDRVEAAFAAAAPRGPEAVLEALRGGVRGWRGERAPDDDETLLVVAYEGAPRPAPVTPGEARREAEALASERAALARLADAERCGHRLVLSAELDALDAIHRWLEARPELHAIRANERQWLITALYEVCANVVEHGYGENPRRMLELYWLAPADEPALPPADPDQAAALVRRGWFVIRDEGRAFRPDNWHATDFSAPGARQRGRGIGLDIIHSVMSTVQYHPATERGNVTLLAFGPGAAHSLEKEPIR